MKRVKGRIAPVASSVVVLGLVGVLTAVEPAAPTTASGEGRIHFGKDGDGIGHFVFDVQKQGGSVSGFFQFAGEHHEGYPDIVIQMDNVTEAKIVQRSARFVGKGNFHEDSVIITVSVRDGADSGNADHLHVSCANGDGRVVFEAEGHLVAGDISVGAPS